MNRAKEPHAKDPRKLDFGRWQARVTYYDAETGKRHETSQTFATEREAKKWSREEDQRYRTNPNQKQPNNQTLAEFFPTWLQAVEAQGLAAKTVRDYQQMSAHAVDVFGHKPLKNITTWDIQQLYTAMAETHASRTINYVHTVLNRALSDTVDWGFLSTNPAAKAKVPRGQRKPVVILAPDETQHFLKTTHNTRWYTLWALMLHTGLPPGEAIAIRWQDIHWDTHTLHVVQAVSGDGSRRVLGPTKTERSTRPVALGPHIMELLEVRRQEQTMERTAAGDRWEDHDLAFTTGPRNVARDFQKDRQRANLPDTIHSHCLRHYGNCFVIGSPTFSARNPCVFQDLCFA